MLQNRVHWLSVKLIRDAAFPAMWYQSKQTMVLDTNNEDVSWIERRPAGQSGQGDIAQALQDKAPITIPHGGQCDNVSLSCKNHQVHNEHMMIICESFYWPGQPFFQWPLSLYPLDHPEKERRQQEITPIVLWRFWFSKKKNSRKQGNQEKIVHPNAMINYGKINMTRPLEKSVTVKEYVVEYSPLQQGCS